MTHAIWHRAVDPVRPEHILLASALSLGGMQITSIDRSEGLAVDDVVRQLAESGVDMWITCGPSAKEPDEIGPAVCRELSLPYVIAEPRAEVDGAGAEVAGAIISSDMAAADAIEEMLGRGDNVVRFPPLVDVSPYFEAKRSRAQSRAMLAGKLRFPPEVPWIVADGPMEEGAALGSYRVIAESLSRGQMLAWRMLVMGDGPAFDEVEALLQAVSPGRLCLWRDVSGAERLAALACADMYVWPAYEGVGVQRLLEAQAAGVAVVSSREPGVAERVRDGVTGRVALSGNPASFSNAITFLLRQPDFRSSFARAAHESAVSTHDIRAAGGEVVRALSRCLERDL